MQLDNIKQSILSFTSWLKEISTRIIWWKIFVLFFIPFLLSIPFPPYKDIAKLSGSEEIKIPTEVQSLGIPLFSKFSGIETFKIPMLLCLWNKNEIYFDGKKMKQKELVDAENAGAVSFKISYPDSDIIDDLYASRGTLKCINLRANLSREISVSDKGELKNPLPIKQPVIEPTVGGFSVKIEPYQNSSITVRLYMFSVSDLFSQTFLANYIIFVIAFGILTTQFIQIKNWVLKPSIKT